VQQFCRGWFKALRGSARRNRCDDLRLSVLPRGPRASSGPRTPQDIPIHQPKPRAEGLPASQGSPTTSVKLLSVVRYCGHHQHVARAAGGRAIARAGILSWGYCGRSGTRRVILNRSVDLEVPGWAGFHKVGPDSMAIRPNRLQPDRADPRARVIDGNSLSPIRRFPRHRETFPLVRGGHALFAHIISLSVPPPSRTKAENNNCTPRCLAVRPRKFSSDSQKLQENDPSPAKHGLWPGFVGCPLHSFCQAVVIIVPHAAASVMFRPRENGCARPPHSRRRSQGPACAVRSTAA